MKRSHIQTVSGRVSWAPLPPAADFAPGGIPDWKRALDICGIVLLLPVWMPLMLLIALVIKVVSSGPVLFRQERIGYLGRRFSCLKFRTMRTGADCTVHRNHLDQLIRHDVPMTKMDQAGDPRLIPLGAFLRSCGLDELPQLINVWRGEMSLVGPRPCIPYEYERYLPRHRQRCAVLPGLTGLWQVSGKNKTTFTQMIELDLRYVATQSWWLDVRILGRTFGVLFAQVKDLHRRANGPPDAAASQSRQPGRSLAGRQPR